MEKQKFYLTSFCKNTNGYNILRSREYGKSESYRVNMPILRSLACHKTSTFSKVSTQQSPQSITYDDGKIYMYNYRKCKHVCGPKDKPFQAYSLPVCPVSEKIEDCITASCPLAEILTSHKGYRSCKLAVTANNFLKRYDLENGELLQQVYISPRYKFRSVFAQV